MKTKQNIQIRVYRGESVSNGALAAAELPDRLKILPWGDSESTKGRVTVGLKTLSALASAQRLLGFERVALDFEHNTVPGTRTYKESGEPRPVAAYGTVEVIEGEGLFLTGLVWTPEGSKAARNFEDLSPAVRQDDTGEVLFVHSVALTRNGAVHDLTFYSVSAETDDEQGEKYYAPTTQEETQMKGALARLLGLNAEATDEQIEQAAEKAGMVIVALSAIDMAKLQALSALSAEDLQAKLTVLSAVGDSSKATLEGLVTRIGAIEGSLQTFSAEKIKGDRQQIKDRAAREGKVIPLSAEQIGAMELTVLSSLVDKLPVTVPVDQRTVEDTRTFAAGGSERNNADRGKIAAAFGLKVEDFK